METRTKKQIEKVEAYNIKKDELEERKVKALESIAKSLKRLEDINECIVYSDYGSYIRVME